MKLKLVSFISFSLLVFMKLATAADNGVVQGSPPTSPENMPSPEQIKQMQKAGLLPEDLSTVDPATFQGGAGAQPAAQGANPPQAPMQPSATTEAVQQSNNTAAQDAKQNMAGTGSEIQHSIDNNVNDAGGSLKIDAPKLPLSKPAATLPKPAQTDPAEDKEENKSDDASSSSDSSEAPPDAADVPFSDGASSEL